MWSLSGTGQGIIKLVMPIDEILKFDEHGLIPAIIQGYKSNQVLKMVFMNHWALEQTVRTGLCHFNRSRREFWLEEGTAESAQVVKEIYFDCDADCLLVKVDEATHTCHADHETCFFNKATA